MPSLIKISEAASLALHTMVILAGQGQERVSARNMAALMGASEAHLAKVLQRLVHQGLVKSSRGPTGGFSLARPPEDTTLLGVYEAIEGPMTETGCLLAQPICAGQNCILGGLVQSLNREVRDYLGKMTLREFQDRFPHLKSRAKLIRRRPGRR